MRGEGFQDWLIAGESEMAAVGGGLPAGVAAHLVARWEDDPADNTLRDNHPAHDTRKLTCIRGLAAEVFMQIYHVSTGIQIFFRYSGIQLFNYCTIQLFSYSGL